MMKKANLLIISLLMVLGSAKSQTQLGLRAVSAPQFIPYYQDLGAKVSRQIRRDYEMTGAGIDMLGEQLQGLKELGITTIVCMRFPNHPSDVYQADRVPLRNAADLRQSLAVVDSMLIKLNGKLDFFQLQNEPLGGPGKYLDVNSRLHLGYYAIQWLDTLARHVKNTIEQHQLSMGIISPAFHDVENALTNEEGINSFSYIFSPSDTILEGESTLHTVERYWFREQMRIAKTYCDLIDIHLNVKDLPAFRQAIKNLDSLQQLVLDPGLKKPYSSLEWSQTKEKQQFILQQNHLRQFLDSAYQYHVRPEDWQAFMHTLNYDTTFMQRAFCVMDSANFVHACYAGLLQYGTAGDLSAQIFSTCALLTNSTVDPISPGVFHPNEPFYSLFKQITACKATSLQAGPAAEPGVELFPNPSDGVLHLRSRDLMQKITIFAADGRQLMDLNPQAKAIELDVSGLQSGLYLLVVNRRYGRRFWVH